MNYLNGIDTNFFIKNLYQYHSGNSFTDKKTVTNNQYLPNKERVNNKLVISSRSFLGQTTIFLR